MSEHLKFPVPSSVTRAEAETAVARASRRYPGQAANAYVREAARFLEVDTVTVQRALRASHDEPIPPAHRP